MNRISRIRMIALLAVGACVAPAFASDLTVGRFYSEIARVRQMSAVDAVSAEHGLRAAGFKLPVLSLNKGLTEGDVIGIAQAMGIRVTTQRPSHPFSDEQLAVFSEVFGGQLKGAAVDRKGNVFQAFGNDQGQNGNGQGQNNNNQGQDKSRSRL